MNRRVYLTKESFFEQNEALGTYLPYSEDLSVLGTPITVGNKTLPNRLACQAMEGCDGNADGTPAELTIRRYKRFAEGGSAIIWFEATACREDGRANPRQLWITEDNLDSFKKIVNDIKEYAMKSNGFEPLIIMQATHSGRYSKPHGVPEPLIAYNNPIFEGDKPIDKSRILSDDELDRIGAALVESSKLAEEAGFDGVDIKCCHRYINSELLSAYERDGKYGGSFENRTRLLRKSIEGAMQSTGKDFIVSSRLNVYDGFKYPYGFGVSKNGGVEFDPAEPIRLLKELRALGVELLNITMGNPYFNPHVNRPFALGGYDPAEHPLEGVARMLNGIALLKKEVPDMKIISSALSYLGVVAPQVCAGYIKDGGFDFCGFGRTILAYPDYANDILAGGMKKEKICLCCSKCSEMMRAGGTPGCVMRDKLYSDIYREFKENQK
ncbi:MAG: flavin oxidoreductase/NADH oxidase [Clostridia bacterium]|nr:flavin oxidoreductase/NADH oxidase [Clostridia bacterium]